MYGEKDFNSTPSAPLPRSPKKEPRTFRFGVLHRFFDWDQPKKSRIWAYSTMAMTTGTTNLKQTVKYL